MLVQARRINPALAGAAFIPEVTCNTCQTYYVDDCYWPYADIRKEDIRMTEFQIFTLQKINTSIKASRRTNMIFLRLLMSIMLFLATACVSHTSSGESNTGTSDVERILINTKDREREYLLYIPSSLKDDDRKSALVMFMHGGGGTAQFAVREVGKTLFKLAEENGFYVIFPAAVNKMWDFGAGRVSKQLKERIDDRSYFASILDDASTRLSIDPKRIFVTGISRGGQASYYIACQFPGRIRAIAPVAMPLPSFLEDTCRAGPPVGVAIMNGTKDPLVPYDGGTITVGKKKRDEVLSTMETIELWNKRNGCDPKSSTQTIINPALDKMRVEKTEWRRCTGAPVMLYRIVGGGHTWPGGKQYLPKFVVGMVNQDIDGAETAWNFFREFR